MNESIQELLATVPLLQGLSPDEINTLDGYLSEVRLEVDDDLFNEGDDSDYVGFVIYGRLDVIKSNMEGHPSVIANIPKGSSIGEMSLVDSLKRSATVRANTGTTLHVLRNEDFERLLDEQPRIGIKILRHIARTLSLNLRKTSNILSDSLYMQ